MSKKEFAIENSLYNFIFSKMEKIMSFGCFSRQISTKKKKKKKKKL